MTAMHVGAKVRLDGDVPGSTGEVFDVFTRDGEEWCLVLWTKRVNQYRKPEQVARAELSSRLTAVKGK